MPRIKAYKNGTSKRQLIPVETAKVSTAFRCPWTGKIFGEKRSYVMHLKELREQRMYRRARQARFEKVRVEFNGQKTWDDVIQWIENHPEFFFDLGMRSRVMSNPKPLDRENLFIKITYLRLVWSPTASNTHSCPRNGKTNWGGRDDGSPRSYPGWEGRIEFQAHQFSPDGTLRESSPFSGSDLFDRSGINTGSGGARGKGGYAYGVTFFDADWPGITERCEKLDTLTTLKGDKKPFHRAYMYNGNFETARDKVTI